MNINDFSYDLPEELIAQEPIQKRDTSRLLVMRIEDGSLEHRVFTDLLDYLEPGDALVINETKVIPARLLGVKEGGGAQVEVLLLKPLNQNCWEALVKPGKKLPVGTRIQFGAGILSALVAD